MQQNIFRAFLFVVSQVTLWCLAINTVQAQVVINELYPNPNTGEEEWVELYNTGESAVELTGWELWDQLSAPSKIHSFLVGDQLEAQTWLVIPLTNKLNNGGDTVSLKDANGQEVDSLIYLSSTKGKSWAKNPDDLAEVVAADPSRGDANPLPSPIPTPVFTPAPTPLPTPSPQLINSYTDPNLALSTGQATTNTPTVLGTSITDFTYPLTVLKSKLTYDHTNQFTSDHLAFMAPPSVEAGALSVIMGSLLLLVPGLVYVKKRQQHF